MLNIKVFVPQPSTPALEEVHSHGLCDCWHVPERITVLDSCQRLNLLPAPEVNRVLVAFAQLEFCMCFDLQGIIQVSNVPHALLVITNSSLLCLKPKLVVKMFHGSFGPCPCQQACLQL